MTTEQTQLFPDKLQSEREWNVKVTTLFPVYGHPRQVERAVEEFERAAKVSMHNRCRTVLVDVEPTGEPQDAAVEGWEPILANRPEIAVKEPLGATRDLSEDVVLVGQSILMLTPAKQGDRIEVARSAGGYVGWVAS